MWPFSKKKNADPGSQPQAAAADDGKPQASGPPPDASVQVQISMMSVDITKINAQLESFMEIRKSFTERFSTINEQIGEIRGQIMDTNRNMGVLEVKATKAADLVESVQPDKIMIQVQKEDGKIEGIRAMVEAKDAMMQNILEQLRTLRNQVNVFKGVSQVVKLNEEIKDEIMNAKRIVAIVEQHSDKVENVFVESQKAFQEFNQFATTLEATKADIKELQNKLEKLDAESTAALKKKEFEDRIKSLEANYKKMKGLTDSIERAYGELDNKFKDLRGELRGAFDDRLKRAEIISKAFGEMVGKNPSLAKGLDLSEFIGKGGDGEKPKEAGKEEKKEEKK
ncbi:MAG: hypothetical protein V1735_04015 [Nanoarchaeota archaeon]